MPQSNLTLGSLFSGSGGFELGGILAGIIPIWNSEIEPFAIRVTTKRLPGVIHYGDVSSLNGAELPPADIITFGSPCQDMSIAGKREGLDGERSGLFYQAIRIIREMREKTDGEKPRYIVWENVPGAFSSNNGEDFKAVLEAVISLKEPNVQVPAPENKRWPKSDVLLGNGWSVAYRALDAQYWGVPQRRARIFLVADFAGERAGEILFKSEGLSGYSAESFRAWQAAAGDTGKGTEKTGGTVCLNDQGGSFIDVSNDVSGTLRAEAHGNNPVIISLEHHPTDSRIKIDDSGIIQTLTKRMGTGGNNVPLIMAPEPYTLKIRCGKEGGGKGPLIQKNKSATLSTVNDQTLFAYGISSKNSNAMLSDNPHSGIYEADTSRTLDENGGNPSCNQGGIAVVSAKDNGAHPVYATSKTSYHTDAEKNMAHTLVATDYKDPPTVTADPDYIVRRLTPTECARLQGFPDWWCRGLGTENPSEEEIAFWTEVFETHRKVVTGAKKPKTRSQIIKWLKDPYTDSAEYRLWGNGVCLPIVFFILSGIVWADGKSI